MNEFTTKQFSGPLDLLLSLLAEKKLDISEVALAEVTEQFLQYIDTLEQKDPAELADFLVIATKLLVLKSRMLLPAFQLEEDGDEHLEDQLRLYEMFVEASAWIQERFLDEQQLGAFRIEPPKRAEGFVPPKNLSTASMHERMRRLIKRLKPPKPLPKTTIDRTVSMKRKIDHIRTLLDRESTISFHDVLENRRNRTEVIVGFIALLELVKQRSVLLKQDATFGDIVIERC
jgi:segregation and condensation protein A